MAKKPVRKRGKTMRALDAMEEMNREIDRRVEAWARGLRIEDGGRVRRLTEEEIQIAVGREIERRPTRAASVHVARKPTNRRRRRG